MEEKSTKMATKIPTDSEFWSNKITWYVVKHRMSYKRFAELCGCHEQSLYAIVGEKTKKVSPKMLGKLLQVLDTEEPPCYN